VVRIPDLGAGSLILKRVGCGKLIRRARTWVQSRPKKSFEGGLTHLREGKSGNQRDKRHGGACSIVNSIGFEGRTFCGVLKEVAKLEGERRMAELDRGEGDHLNLVGSL